MNQPNASILKDEIQWLLEAIQEQFETIRAREEKIPQIEYDMLIENTRRLYEKLLLLQKIRDPYPEHVKKSSSESPMEPVPDVPAIPSPPPENLQPEKPAMEKPEVKGYVPRGKKDAGKTEKHSETDLFSDENLRFTEKLREVREKTMGPRMKAAKPNDLKALISINEKFLFINELFDGNLRDYNENIETLGGFTDLKAALDYLDQLRRKNLWESESNAFGKLKEILERKFR